MEALRADIQAGIESGPAEPLVMQEIEAAARDNRTKGNKALARG